MKDIAIDSVVLAALQLVSLPTWRQAQVRREAESLSFPGDTPSSYTLADRGGIQQTLLARALLLEGESKDTGSMAEEQEQ